MLTIGVVELVSAKYASATTVTIASPKQIPSSPDTARVVRLKVDETPTTGVEPFIDDAGVHCIIDIALQPSTALGVRAEHEGLVLLVGDALRVVTAGGDDEFGVPDMVSEEAAAICARPMARYSHTEAASTDTHLDLLIMLGFLMYGR